MPLTPKGTKIKANMQKEYGPERGERIFYASANKGTITGVEPREPRTSVPTAERYRGRRADQRRMSR